jgi:hypothetical protein
MAKVLNQAVEVYKDLPTWAKGVTVIGVLGIGYIIYNRIYKSFKERSKTEFQRETQREQENEVKNLENTGMRKTFPSSQYKAWADTIASEFDGCDPLGTSLGAVANAINPLKNDLDFLSLSTAFGIRTYDKCGFSWATGEFTGNLSQAVNLELTVKERAFINKILADKKISYRFN